MDDTFLTSAQVCERFGSVSQMTLWRWTRDLGFPKPDLILNRRKFWKRETIAAWQAAQAKPVAA